MATKYDSKIPSAVIPQAGTHNYEVSKMVLDTDCMTMPRFILHLQKQVPKATGEFSNLMVSIQAAVKAVSSAVRKAGIANMHGFIGRANVHGGKQKKLEALANDLFINMLASSLTTCVLISEEQKDIIEIDQSSAGKYVVAFDPLDGCSNIDCLASLGSIWAVFRKTDGRRTIFPKDYLQSGRKMVAAGYALYGSATSLVLATEIGGVNAFILDPSIGEFILTEQSIRIPTKGNIYSINEGYTYFWDRGIFQYVSDKKNPSKGQPYSGRYVGTTVADVHRTLKYGGIYLYPATKDSPQGKLRLLYEAAPMAYIMEKAGGSASTGLMPVLDVVPQGIHDRVPVILGSPADVQDCLDTVQRTKEDMSNKAMAHAAKVAEQAHTTTNSAIVPVPPPL